MAMVSDLSTENASEFLRCEAEQRWQRLLERPEVDHGNGALGHLAKLPQDRPEWWRVWGASVFVSEQCARHPDMLSGLLEAGLLDQQVTPESVCERVRAATGGCAEETSLHQQLRRCRMREMVRIAWRDLGGLSNLEETMAGVSALADVYINETIIYHTH